MRTKIQGGYVVGFNGEGHRIIPCGVVVFEEDRITHVGRSYDGHVDETIDARGKLVSPGFINIHAIASIDITHFRIDGSRSALRTSKAYIVDGVGNLDLVGEDLRTSARFCVVELLKGGATTSVPITAMGPSRFEAPRDQARVIAETVGELGARAYVSHHYRSGPRYWTKDGAVRFHFDEKAGRAGLETALEFAEEYEGAYDDRIRTMLFPYQFDTCSAELLQATKEAAREHDLKIHMHTAQSLAEFHESLRRYGKTPIEYLYHTGFLDSDVIVTHVTNSTLNPLTGYPKGDTRDIEMLADSGATVAHTPWIYSERGGYLHSFGAFKRMGVNLAIGTDAFPMDMIMEMRHGAIMGKLAEQNPAAVTAADVFNAATLGGAKALGREDLGRLSPGAKADIVVVDLTRSHVGLVDDPIKSLIYFASERDIETVIVDGKTVVEDGCVPGVDERALTKEANAVNQRQKMAFVVQHPAGSAADELFTTSFPLEE
jgi:cytosine/adenosine deaminase-related metal-dependent hydrolase